MATTLIVGGTSGIGLAVSQQLSRSGDEVHIAGRSRKRLERALATVDARGHLLDGSESAAVEALARSIAPLDRLVITLAGSGGTGPLAGVEIGDLRRAFDEKYWPTVTVMQAALPALAERASVTLVGAVTARAAMPGTAGIGSLNAAVEGLVQPLAAELAPIRVNAVSPGYVDTPWWDGFPAAQRDAFFAQAAAALPTGRIATASDIAEAIVLLATNPNITGTVLVADGGARLTA
ncbi:SDR family oxidoreductase [Tsukamurella sp. 8F]|uniref:SDR family oxidoreductase n=1 Tax=unclassified Tsukamurella TaxID=2633480 RepID=UPI0023B90B5E|nr:MULTISPECIES: SDR family oxidoreductase [unclassified Tsukamurella]MDF0529065.1 SDR family oxidoreductase [Tsukamurella sp. 8J]MDF0587439.1 SDR family oxidoreductase [Tsukamurella sp. 8F]